MTGVSADVLAACVDDIRAGRRSIDQCVATHPSVADELRGLLAVAVAVSRPPPVAPDQAFRLRARVALVETIHREGAARRAPPLVSWWSRQMTRSPAMSALIIALVLSLVGGSGAVYASRDALPGDTLYPVKIGFEGAQLVIVTDPGRRAEAHLSLAARRAVEIERASQSGRGDAVDIAATRFAGEVESAERAVAAAHASGEDVSAVSERLAENLARQQAALEGVAARAPASAAAGLTKAIGASTKGLANAAARTDGKVPATAEGRGSRPETAGKPSTAVVPSPTNTPVPAAGLEPTSTTTPTTDATAPAATAVVALSELQTETARLADDPLVPGQSERGLLAKLEAAEAALDRGQPDVATRMLAAFENELEAMWRSSHIDRATYDALRARAIALRAQLEAVPARVKPGRSAATDATPTGNRADPGPTEAGKPTARPSAPSKGKP